MTTQKKRVSNFNATVIEKRNFVRTRDPREQEPISKNCTNMGVVT